MMFDVHKVDQNIIAWITPDNPSTLPKVIIKSPEAPPLELETNELRVDVKAAGMHHTGQVGFQINRATVPELPSVDNLQIWDAHTNILIHREFNPDHHIPKRVLRFEMQAMPHATTESAWNDAFQLYYGGVERLPYETMFAVMNNPRAESLAIAGRLNISRYEHVLKEWDYKIVALLRDPYEELAERLLFVRYALQPNNADRFRHYLSGLDNYAIIARRIDFGNPGTLVEAFAQLNDRQMDEIANPLTRSLACGIDEIPRTEHVEFALSKLAAMSVVGIRSQYSSFRNNLRNLLGTDIAPQQAPATVSVAKALVAELKEIKLARTLISLDVKLFGFVETALQRALDNPDLGLDLEALPDQAVPDVSRDREEHEHESAVR
jgi:hypothetical protein